MAKILTALVLTAGFVDISKAITGVDPVELANDINELAFERDAAIKEAQQAKADLNDALALNDKHIATIEGLHDGVPQIVVTKGEETFKVDNAVFGLGLRN